MESKSKLIQIELTEREYEVLKLMSRRGLRATTYHTSGMKPCELKNVREELEEYFEVVVRNFENLVDDSYLKYGIPF